MVCSKYPLFLLLYLPTPCSTYVLYLFNQFPPEHNTYYYNNTLHIPPSLSSLRAPPRLPQMACTHTTQSCCIKDLVIYVPEVYLLSQPWIRPANIELGRPVHAPLRVAGPLGIASPGPSFLYASLAEFVILQLACWFPSPYPCLFHQLKGNRSF